MSQYQLRSVILSVYYVDRISQVLARLVVNVFHIVLRLKTLPSISKENNISSDSFDQIFLNSTRFDLNSKYVFNIRKP